MSTDLLHSMSVFIQVAKTKSFTGASARLGLSPSAISKAIARLEGRLGVRLLYRTTRKVSLTDDGHAFLEQSRQILSALEDIESALTRRRVKPRGRLRIQAPLAFGRKVVMPLIQQFSDLNPELVVDVELSDRTPDLAGEGLDAAVRSGELKDSMLVARKLCNLEYIAVASPKYVRRHGEPQIPTDLADHRCIGSYLPHTHRYRNWPLGFESDGFPKPLHGRLNINSSEAIMDAAINGFGVAFLATFLATEPIRRGLLRPLLKKYIIPGGPVWLVYSQRQLLSPRVKTLVEFLTLRIPRQVKSIAGA